VLALCEPTGIRNSRALHLQCERPELITQLIARFCVLHKRVAGNNRREEQTRLSNPPYRITWRRNLSAGVSRIEKQITVRGWPPPIEEREDACGVWRPWPLDAQLCLQQTVGCVDESGSGWPRVGSVFKAAARRHLHQIVLNNPIRNDHVPQSHVFVYVAGVG
jgi:hypothetical protein